MREIDQPLGRGSPGGGGGGVLKIRPPFRPPRGPFRLETDSPVGLILGGKMSLKTKLNYSMQHLRGPYRDGDGATRGEEVHFGSVCPPSIRVASALPASGSLGCKNPNR
jgi:hypothetical protein